MKFQEPDFSQLITTHTPIDIAAYQHWLALGACPDLAKPLTIFLKRMSLRGHDVAITQLHRTAELQESMYAQGRTTPGRIITDARPWQSAHCANIRGCPASQAFDVAIRNGSQISWAMDNTTARFWSDARDTGNMLGLRWGATFNTPPRDFGHFQLSTFKGNPQ